MSLLAHIWGPLAPITAVILSLFSCGHSTTSPSCGEPQVEPSVPPVVNYIPIIPPSIPYKKRDVLSRSPSDSLTPQFTVSHESTLSLVRCSAPHPVVFIRDIIYLVFLLLDSVTLSRCVRVCRPWSQIAHPLQWRHALSLGIHPLLCYLDTFYMDDTLDAVYKKRRVSLSSLPSMSSWRKFENRAGQYIQSLTINTSFLHTSWTVLLYLNESSPEKFELPMLTRLRLIVDQTHVELDFARKFMQDTVKELRIDIWEPLPDQGRAVACMRREAEAGLPRFKRNDAYPPYPLDSFLAAIADDMPHITNLSFTMRDMRQITRAWPALVALWLRLQKLEHLQLPRRVLTVPAISFVARHPSIKHIGMCGRGTHNIAPSEPYDGLIVLRNVSESLKSSRISEMTELTVTASPSEILYVMSASGKLNLTILHLNLSASFENVADVNVLLAAIAETCPALEDFKICPITAVNEQRSPIRLTYPLLRPLRRCRNLISLEVVSPLVSNLRSKEFKRLVSAWKKLQRLILDHPQASVLKPQESARLSLEVALRALRKHCPTICTLFLNVSPDIKASSSDTMTPTNVADNTLLRLQTVSLCIGYPPEKASPTQLAHYLCLQLPHDCQVELHVAARRVSPVLETPEVREWWLKHHRDLNRFITRVTSVRIALADYHTMTEF